MLTSNITFLIFAVLLVQHSLSCWYTYRDSPGGSTRRCQRTFALTIRPEEDRILVCLFVCLLACLLACLSICLSVHPLACLKNRIQISCTHYPITHYTTRGLVLGRQCKKVMCFVIDDMFSHNAENRPESKMTRVSSSSPGGGTG